MLHPNRFSGKVALVTGAAQGIGKTVALQLLQEAGSVVMVDRSPIVNEIASQLSEDHKNKALPVVADLEQFSGFQSVVEQAVAKFGRIDILINNVGGTIWMKPFATYEEDQIEKEIRRSLFPTLWGCRAVLPVMLDQKGGVIVNVSSVATRGINRVPYAAAKGGVNALTAAMAFEYAEKNIRVNAVAPGGTEAPERLIPRNETPDSEQEKLWRQEVANQTTESSLMKRYGTIEEQTSAILFLASDEASYITGVTIPVAGGDLG
ncbi:benzoate diol dehydrogenase BenD [Flavobacterium gawalongense]|uniref:1,6-dihydroxycyclohexa-2,4-diene-1-carboxylate dehydrogenase n=1 Tax=Flavobacterium gawalongense TaxID=2594432 RepID=A0ABY3CNU4_9FLAO|nr:benzoate diol dehydrogenase BenD [Flavobacterium gawalongense]TRX03741.1 1,6-dihydroxycyclohexa-2,4-diene-1-carboxylate dehydrogenase [Flavobacterium gawalongense]TRX08888.1 1,6-dihydroxycyclohexa-2,4-diene-1-carboxylate dehydrogenase [Flavobacterium gawalongense]